MPTKCVPEELKQPTLSKRKIWERQGAVVMFGSEQLTKGIEGRGDKVMDEDTSGSCEFVLGGTHNQHSPRQPGRAIFSN